MKVLLMNRVSLDNFLLMKYLEVKGVPFWVYVHDPVFDRMEQVVNYTDGLLINSHFSLYKQDFGPYVESDAKLPDDYEHCYFYEDMDKIRTDKHLILLYRGLADIYEKTMRLEDVPDGEEFAVIHITDADGGVKEKLILKSQLNWMKSE